MYHAIIVMSYSFRDVLGRMMNGVGWYDNVTCHKSAFSFTSKVDSFHPKATDHMKIITIRT
jgi:hypothetical protein